MHQNTSFYEIEGTLGYCGYQRAFLGFAPADLLLEVSFSDVLDEETGQGYQRPFLTRHSKDFRRYIQKPDSTTIPLTFNLRSEKQRHWRLFSKDNCQAVLRLQHGKKSMAQVDCQHRLGELSGLSIPLAIMCFIRLDLRQEMAVFHVINSKSKGLSSSLTDYHQSNLMHNLVEEAPHLFIARKLNEDSKSPWYRLIKYGGQTTSGLKRRTSLRMMQKSVQKFLKRTETCDLGAINDCYDIIVMYWKAVRKVFQNDWNNHRHSLITKGIGLYSLMGLLSDIVLSTSNNNSFHEDFFIKKLEPLKSKIDWNTHGMFSDAGGHKGSIEVQNVLRKAIGL